MADEIELQIKLFKQIQEKGAKYFFCLDQVQQRTTDKLGEITKLDSLSILGFLEAYRIGSQTLELMNFYLENCPEPPSFAEVVQRCKKDLTEIISTQEGELSKYLQHQAAREGSLED